MGIVKGKGGRDYSKELGRNAGPGRDEIRANTLRGLVPGAQGHGQGFRAAYACGGGHTPGQAGLWKIKEAKGGGVSHEESQGESLGSRRVRLWLFYFTLLSAPRTEKANNKSLTLTPMLTPNSWLLPSHSLTPDSVFDSYSLCGQ